MTDMEMYFFFAFGFLVTCLVVRILMVHSIIIEWYEYVCKMHVQAITRFDERGYVNSWDCAEYDSDYYLINHSLLSHPKHWLKFRIKQFKEFEEFNEKMRLLIEKGK